MPWRMEDNGMKPEALQMHMERDDFQRSRDISFDYFAHRHGGDQFQPPTDPLIIKEFSDPMPLSDYFDSGPAGILVSHRFRDIVQAWDPVTHVYVPVEIHRKDGTVLCDQYFVFYPMGSLDGAIVIEESDVVETRVNARSAPYLAAKHTPPRLMWKGSKVAGRHLWTERRLMGNTVISDALYAAMQKDGIGGFQAQESRISKLVE